MVCAMCTIYVGGVGSLIYFEIENKEDGKSFGEYLKFPSVNHSFVKVVINISFSSRMESEGGGGSLYPPPFHY